MSWRTTSQPGLGRTLPAPNAPVTIGAPGAVYPQGLSRVTTFLAPSGADDTAALNEAFSSYAPAAHPDVLLGPGTFHISAPVSIPAVARLRGSGTDSTTIVATAAMAEAIIVNSAGGQTVTIEDLSVEGAALATNCLLLTIASETSVPHRITRVSASGATGYQIVNQGCEDTTFLDCRVPGDEAEPATTPLAAQIVIPEGAMRILGGEYFGQVEIEAQLVQVSGATLGPILISNPAASPFNMLSLTGCYVYDGGPNSASCISPNDNLTSITASGCYFVAQVNRSWLNGNIPDSASIHLANSSFIWGPGSAGTNFILTGSGSGALVVLDYQVNAGSATTEVFDRLAGATTSVTTLDQGNLAVYSKLSTSANVLDDGSGNLTTGGTITSGGLGVSLHNDGVISFNNTGGGQLLSGTGAPTMDAPEGALFFRTDTPSTDLQRLYIQTASPSGATWTGIL